MATAKIQITKQYDMFKNFPTNRDVNLDDRKTKNLAESMVEYGWLDAYPAMVVKKNGTGGYYVQDGQHRIAIAKEFDIPVKYIVEAQDIDVAKLNNTSKGWKATDYVQKYAKQGNDHYIELLEFHEHNPIPLTICASLLSSQSGQFGGNISEKICSGRFIIKSWQQANRIAQYYKYLIALSPRLKKSYSIAALAACFYIDYFDPDRLISGAEKKITAIRNMGTTEGFLELFEELYNFHQKKPKPLKFDAEQAMRAKSPIKSKAA